MAEELLVNWSSWAPLMHVALQALGEGVDVLEIGSGHGSKIVLGMKHVASLDSIEVDSEWAKKAQLEDPRHTVFHSWKGEPSWLAEKIHPRKKRYGVALVDGINENRVMSVNLIARLGLARVILIHDFGEDDKAYHWDMVTLPDGWRVRRISGLDGPDTGLAVGGDEVGLLERIVEEGKMVKT